MPGIHLYNATVFLKLPKLQIKYKYWTIVRMGKFGGTNHFEFVPLLLARSSSVPCVID